MIIGEKELERIEELKHNESLLYNVINYLVELWDINSTKEEIIEHFKQLNFTDEDIEKLEILGDE